MSIKIMTAVWELKLDHVQKLVLLALADNANDAGDCHPAVRRIIEKTCLSESSVRRSIGELQQAGHLTIIERPGRASSYRLHPCTPEGGEASPQAGLPLSRRQGLVANKSTPAPSLLLSGRQDTPVTQPGVTPVQETGHPCQPDRTPLSGRQDTPVSLTPHLREPSWEPSREPSREPCAAFDPTSVAGLNPEVLTRWIGYRKQIGKSLKPASLEATARKLSGFGADQAAVVEQSIGSGWTNLYPLKQITGSAPTAPSPALKWTSSEDRDTETIRQAIVVGRSNLEIFEQLERMRSLEWIQAKRAELSEEQHAQH